MAKSRKTSTDPSHSILLKAIKAEVDQKATDLIENVLKPKHIEPPPKGHQLNYLVDITTKWLGSKCYLVSVYCSPGPNAISPTFEAKFARLEFVGNDKKFNSICRSCGIPENGSCFTSAFPWMNAWMPSEMTRGFSREHDTSASTNWKTCVALRDSGPIPSSAQPHHHLVREPRQRPCLPGFCRNGCALCSPIDHYRRLGLMASRFIEASMGRADSGAAGNVRLRDRSLGLLLVFGLGLAA